jgi:hypothetical protein
MTLHKSFPSTLRLLSFRFLLSPITVFFLPFSRTAGHHKIIGLYNEVRQYIWPQPPESMLRSLVADGGVWLASRSGRFTPAERARINCTDCRTGQGVMKRLLLVSDRSRCQVTSTTRVHLYQDWWPVHGCQCRMFGMDQKDQMLTQAILEHSVSH